MKWKIICVGLLVLVNTIIARPGIRTPPESLLQENITESTPLIERAATAPNNNSNSTNGRYLMQGEDLVNANYLDTAIEPNNGDIFDMYKSSSNFILNDFLQKNIVELTKDKISDKENDILLSNDNSMDIIQPTTTKRPTKTNKADKYYDHRPQIQKLFTKWTDRYPSDNEELDNYHQKEQPSDILSLTDFLKTYHIHTITTTRKPPPDRFQELVPTVVITSRPVKKPSSYMSNIMNSMPVINFNNLNSKPHAPQINDKTSLYFGPEVSDKIFSTDSNYNNNNIHNNNNNNNNKNNNRKPIATATFSISSTRRPVTNQVADPSDPDPDYENEFDSTTPVSFGGQYDTTGLGMVKNTIGNDPHSKDPQFVDPSKFNRCPGVKLTLNNKLSLNLKPNPGPCGNVKFNVNNNRIPQGVSSTIAPQFFPGNRIPTGSLAQNTPNLGLADPHQITSGVAPNVGFSSVPFTATGTGIGTGVGASLGSGLGAGTTAGLGSGSAAGAGTANGLGAGSAAGAFASAGTGAGALASAVGSASGIGGPLQTGASSLIPIVAQLPAVAASGNAIPIVGGGGGGDHKHQSVAASSAASAIPAASASSLVPVVAPLPAFTGTNVVPVLASVGGVAGGGGGGGGGGGVVHKKPHKSEGYVTGFKNMIFLFTKLFALFSLANPFSFSFWTVMLSPIAVLLAGGTGLAMVLYPFASTFYTLARQSNKSNAATIIVHRHRQRHARPLRWKRPWSKPWRPHPHPHSHSHAWRKSGHSLNGKDKKPEFTLLRKKRMLSDYELDLHELEQFVSTSINKFRSYLDT